MEEQDIQNLQVTEYDPLAYHYLYLRWYLREHHFPIEVIESENVQARADMAIEEFCNARDAGYAVEPAMELANQTLMAGIGSSKYEALSDLLEEYFKDTFDLEVDPFWDNYYREKLRNECPGLDEEVYERPMVGIDHWTRFFLRALPNLFDGFESDEWNMGSLDDELLHSEKRQELVDRIVAWCDKWNWEYHPVENLYEPIPLRGVDDYDD